jgi:hypothetical protein
MQTLFQFVGSFTISILNWNNHITMIM